MDLTAQQGLDLLGLLAIVGIMHALVVGVVCTAAGCFKGGVFRSRART
jgi:hypothetical protein